MDGAWPRLAQLERLDLVQPDPYTNELLPVLRGAPKLTHFAMSNRDIDVREIELLPAKLTSLGLQCSDDDVGAVDDLIAWVGRAPLAKSTSSLVLSNGISSLLRALLGPKRILPSLESLTIEYAGGVSNEALLALRPLVLPRRLVLPFLYDDALEAQTLRDLAAAGALRDVEELDLDTRLSDEALAVLLTNAKKLRRLTISGELLTAAGVAALSPAFERIELLHLKDVEVTKDLLRGLLRSMPSLRSLHVNNYAATPEPLAEVFHDEPHPAAAARNLVRLGLRNCGLGDDGAAKLASFTNLTQLRHLDLRGNDIGERGKKAWEENRFPALACLELDDDE